jgi:aspartate/methionine/tyrosine aminotransferase
MSADMQMARGAVEGGYNLAVGEPVLLQKHLRFPDFSTRGPFEYPTMEGDPHLVERLLALHPESKYVVITNGAKQALAAAFYAFRETTGKKTVQHAAPYWPSYPTIARMNGLNFHTALAASGDEISVITAPNNPNGAQASQQASCGVWDAVYAHPLYGWNGVEPHYQVRIGSASKLLGLSGVRIGWAITNDKWLADAMRRYVEFTTSGVSTVSQHFLAWALDLMEQGNPVECFAAARRELLQNGDALKLHLGAHLDRIEGVPKDGTGMFAWVRPKDPQAFLNACQDAKVAVVTGLACGMDNDWVRLNMMAGVGHTEIALKAIAEKLEDD